LLVSEVLRIVCECLETISSLTRRFFFVAEGVGDYTFRVRLRLTVKRKNRSLIGLLWKSREMACSDETKIQERSQG